MTNNIVQTKKTILDAAQGIMLKRGFNATSIDEICAVAGITKGGFFHHFKDKNSLGTAVAGHYWKFFRSALRTAAFQREKDPLQRLYGFIDFVAETGGSPLAAGCLLGSFTHEVAHSHPDIRNACSISFYEFAEDIHKDLEEARERYVPGATMDTRGIAYFIISVIEGSLIVMRARRDKNIRLESFRHVKRYLETLFRAPDSSIAPRPKMRPNTRNRSKKYDVRIDDS